MDRKLQYDSGAHTPEGGNRPTQMRATWVVHQTQIWGNSSCTLCGRYNDSVMHMINCTSVRKIWRSMHVNVPFDHLEILGFVDRVVGPTDRVMSACIMFGVFEFHRFWSHQPSAHTHDVAHLPHAIIHFALAAMCQRNSSILRECLMRMRRSLAAGFP